MTALRVGAASHLRTEARAFCIWREGKSVKWDCTVRELAAATRLPVEVVRYICAVRGWPVAQSDEREAPLHTLTSIFADNYPRAFA